MNSTHVLWRAFAIPLLLCGALAGCGGAGGRPDVYPVSGKVTMGGNPVEGAMITFSTPGAARAASGITDSNGQYQLTTFDTGDGAVAGDHAVTITKVDSSALDEQMTPDDYMAMMKDSKDNQAPGSDTESNAIPAKYASPSESGLSRTVVAGETNEFNFDLSE